MNNNENITNQNLWDKTKAVLKEKSMALNMYVREEMYRNDNLLFHCKVSRRKKYSSVNANS